jgi:glycolate oxidase FAD binding subunit
VRDYVIGISAVDGRGMPFKGGGRVVKNVAGYDFCKLLTGSLGTLGVITQVTLRTKPIPEQSALVACAVPDLDAADRLLAGLVTSQTTPTAVELLAGPAWDAELTLRAIARPGGGTLYLVAGLEGTGPEVESMVRQLTSEWRAAGCEEPLVVGEVPLLWSKLVEFPASGRSPLALLASVVPSGVSAMVAAARQLDPQCSLQAHAGSGSIVIRLAQLPAEGVARALANRLRPVAAAHHGHVVVLSCEQTSELTHASVFGATDVPVWLMGEVRRKFDPREILNRGRFVC